MAFEQGSELKKKSPQGLSRKTEVETCSTQVSQVQNQDWCAWACTDPDEKWPGGSVDHETGRLYNESGWLLFSYLISIAT